MLPGTQAYQYQGAGVLMTNDEQYDIANFKGFEHTEDWMIDITVQFYTKPTTLTNPEQILILKNGGTTVIEVKYVNPNLVFTVEG